MARKTGVCSSPTCDNEANGEFCRRCYGILYYWRNKKTHAASIQRINQLNRLRGTMDFFVTEKDAENLTRYIPPKNTITLSAWPGHIMKSKNNGTKKKSKKRRQ